MNLMLILSSKRSSSLTANYLFYNKRLNFTLYAEGHKCSFFCDIPKISSVMSRSYYQNAASTRQHNLLNNVFLMSINPMPWFSIQDYLR